MQRYTKKKSRTVRLDSMGAAQLLAALNCAPHIGLAVCDARLRFHWVNAAFASMDGMPALGHRGKTIRDIFGRDAGKIEATFKRVFRTGSRVLNVEICAQLASRKQLSYWIESHFPIRNEQGKVRYVAALVVEVTEERKLRESLRCLSGKLLLVKDLEQRRVARELHDSVNQYHAALKMNLNRLSRFDNPEEQANVLSQSVDLLGKCIEETSTICHLLHPPLLHLGGLVVAVRQYVRGFSERSGIRVDLTISPKLGRFSEVIELTLYRVLQESLTNVYRHSRSSLIKIHLARKRIFVKLQVRDNGRGMRQIQQTRLQNEDASGGVGLSGARERTHDLGGQFEVRSGKTGTLVCVTIPVSGDA
jgi:two-component system, NarL family, sensor kinase